MSDFDQQQREEYFSKRVRAGKRTYYFDVKATRSNDYYVTITESKRLPGESEDRPVYEKHKIFLYKEDFEKFSDGLMEALGYIRENQPGIVSREANPYPNTNTNTNPNPNPNTSNDQPDGSGFTNIEFDDLSK